MYNFNPKRTSNDVLEKLQTNPLKTAVSLYDLIKRPELSYEMLQSLDEERPVLEKEIIMEIQTMIKYEGYIDKQSRQIESFKKLEYKRSFWS